VLRASGTFPIPLYFYFCGSFGSTKLWACGDESKRVCQLTPLINRGQYYGIAAAVGKIGAFAGSYALDAIQTAAGDDDIAAGRNPFFVASSLAFLAGGLVFLLPHIGQDTIDQEDVRFRAYLTSNGYDTSKMGLQAVEEDSERLGSGSGSGGVGEDEKVKG
jgi:hypothetical protein